MASKLENGLSLSPSVNMIFSSVRVSALGSESDVATCLLVSDCSRIETPSSIEVV